MGHGDRISALDASFLHLQKSGARMHVASIFKGPGPTWDELREHVEPRLHLVPRSRRRLAEVRGGQGRPVWVDDPHDGESAEPAPATPLDVRVVPHRRYGRVDAELAELRAIKDSLGGTFNDAILAVVAGALGRRLRRRAVDTRDLVPKALVPISVRAEDSEHGVLVAPLPVGIEGPVEQYRAIRDAKSVLEGTREAEKLGFGLLADYDALADVDVLAGDLREAIDTPAAAVSIPRRAARGRRSAAPRSSVSSTD